jgi:hypothetical protein
MFYVMHVLTIIITCTFLAELEVQENKFGSYMRTGVMEYAQGYYIHEEEIIGLHVSMGNAETKSNGRRDRKEPVTMRSLHRKRYLKVLICCIRKLKNTLEPSKKLMLFDNTGIPT